tara:strand:- start:2604 stop:3500 length:897 start_codon:yes stop_codon:yes gene_type:complete
MSQTKNPNPSDNNPKLENEKLTLGDYIKRAREAKQIELGDLARENRMTDEYLTYLEQGNYAQLPGDTYVRAYLKSIAKRLQLSEEKILTWYLKETKQEVPHDLDHVIKIVNDQPHDTQTLQKGKVVILLVVIIGLFGAAQLMNFLSQKWIEPADKSQTSAVTGAQNTADSNKTESLIQKDSLKQDSIIKNLDRLALIKKDSIKGLKSGSGKTRTVSKSVKTLLSLSTTKDSTWISVNAKGSKQFAIWLRKGQKPQYLSRLDTISLEIGQPEILNLKLNGQLTKVTQSLHKIYNGKLVK